MQLKVWAHTLNNGELEFNQHPNLIENEIHTHTHLDSLDYIINTSHIHLEVVDDLYPVAYKLEYKIDMN